MVFRESHNARVQSLHLKGVAYFVQQALQSIYLQLMAVSLGVGEGNVNNILADRGASARWRNRCCANKFGCSYNGTAVHATNSEYS